MPSPAIKRKLEGEIEIRVGGGDAFHEFFQNRPHHIANVHPELVQDCELHDGAFGKVGSKICWRYTLDGKQKFGKQILDVIDEKNKIIKFRMVEGDLMEEYDTFVLTYQVIPKGEELSVVKWIFEYEKKHQGVPEPSSTMDALLNMAKVIDDHHHSNDK